MIIRAHIHPGEPVLFSGIFLYVPDERNPEDVFSAKKRHFMTDCVCKKCIYFILLCCLIKNISDFIRL